jgi:hypothetical protein
MTTLSVIGWGAKFALFNGLALTDLAELTEISMPETEVDVVEATHFGSPQAHREYIAGLIQAGQGTFSMNLALGSVTDQLCRTAVNGRKVLSYKITLPTATGTWEISGNLIVMKHTRLVPLDDKLSSQIAVQFTGASTEVAGV